MIDQGLRSSFWSVGAGDHLFYTWGGGGGGVDSYYIEIYFTIL